MYVQLRGLCPDSYIDQVYIPRNRPRSGNVDLLGFKNTVIGYEGSKLGWTLKLDILPSNIFDILKVADTTQATANFVR